MKTEKFRTPPLLFFFFQYLEDIFTKFKETYLQKVINFSKANYRRLNHQNNKFSTNKDTKKQETSKLQASNARVPLTIQKNIVKSHV